MKRIIGSIFLRYQRPVLEPCPALKKEDGTWTARDDDPFFELNMSGVSMPHGWYRFKLFSPDQQVNDEAIVYFDYGSGYSEANKVRFSSYGDGGCVVVNIGNSVRGLCLHPIARKGRFELQSIGVRAVTPIEVVWFYAHTYLCRQRKMGIGARAAIAAKISQFGGWKNLGISTLIHHVNSYEATRGQGVNDDTVIHDYQEWIEVYERPYFEKKYSSVRSSSVSTNLVLFCVEDEKNEYLSACSDLRSSFDHVFFASVGSEAGADEKSNYTQISYSNVGQLLSKLIQSDKARVNSFFTFVTSRVALGHYFIDAIEVAADRKNSVVDVIYFDNDVIDISGKRGRSHFKPEWDRELYLATQYIGSVCTFSRALLETVVDRVSGESVSEPISTLLLAFAHTLNTERVLRVPEIQYHLLAKSVDAGPDRAGSGPVDQALVEYYLPEYIYDQREDGLPRVLPSLPNREVLVSIVIPTKDQHLSLKTSVESIFEKTSYKNYELIIVDNGTSEIDALDYLEGLRTKSNVEVISSPGPFNYSYLNNLAVARSTAEVIILLNNDVEIITPDWIQELVRYALLPDVGCVGAKLYYPDDTIQHAGVVLGVDGVGGHSQRRVSRSQSGYYGRLSAPQKYSAVTAACMAVQRELFLEVGGLNERDLAVAFNDVDFCLKLIECGYRNIWTPYAELYHYESVSRGKNATPEQAARLAKEASYIMQRWGGVLGNDPAYNPNLSLTSTAFELSQRYLVKPVFNEDAIHVNPCVDPYFYESNIERCNTVMRSAAQPPAVVQSRSSGLSIIILTLEKFDLISALLNNLVEVRKKLASEGPLSIEIIVGDTGSRDAKVLDLYEQLGAEITLVSGLKYQFSKCNNALFRGQATYDTVLFLNNDIIFEDAAYSLSEMYRFLQMDNDVGVVGAYMLYPTGRLQHGGIEMYSTGENKGLCYHPGHNGAFTAPALGYSREFVAVTGACLMMRAELFERCDYYDEAYRTEAQDVDLCLKAHRCGLSSNIVYVGKITHFENATRSKGEFNQKDRSRFIRKWSNYHEVMMNER